MRCPKAWLAVAVAISMLSPSMTVGQELGDQSPDAKSVKPAAKRAAKKTKKYVWKGYGFLPGYRQPPDLTDWRDRSRRFTGRYDRSGRYEQRYWRYGWSGYGQLQYGWGGPGIYRGRWNGGSFGPCWTYTPIGMVWNCGQ